MDTYILTGDSLDILRCQVWATHSRHDIDGFQGFLEQRLCFFTSDTVDGERFDDSNQLQVALPIYVGFKTTPDERVKLPRRDSFARVRVVYPAVSLGNVVPPLRH